jgi:DNA-directed RNA polymerase subunit F
LPENSKCQECLEYCIITPKVARDILEIIQKHESRTIPQGQGAITSYMEKVYQTKRGEKEKLVAIIISLVLAIMITKYALSNATFFQVFFLLFLALICRKCYWSLNSH